MPSDTGQVVAYKTSREGCTDCEPSREDRVSHTPPGEAIGRSKGVEKMFSRSNGSAQRPAAIALWLMLLSAAIALLAVSTANAAQFKMVACASDSGVPGYTTATNTISGANPGGIFEFHNWCGGAGGDPPGTAAFLRIVENQSAGNAGQGAYGQMVFAPFC